MYVYGNSKKPGIGTMHTCRSNQGTDQRNKELRRSTRSGTTLLFPGMRLRLGVGNSMVVRHATS